MIFFSVPVPIPWSITSGSVAWLEDGESFKSMRRRNVAKIRQEPDQYHQKCGFSSNYPMVPPNDALVRSKRPKEISGGRVLLHSNPAMIGSCDA